MIAWVTLFVVALLTIAKAKDQFLVEAAKAFLLFFISATAILAVLG